MPTTRAPQLILATSNPHKVREILHLLAGVPVRILTVEELPPLAAMAREVEESGSTFEENALIKARAVAARFRLVALADDSGLEVAALDGAPGVHSSRFLGKEIAYDVKNLRILDLLREADAPPPSAGPGDASHREADRSARFVCAAALAWPEGRVELFRGECSGEIAREPRGNGGFGYDPIFWLPQFQKTMAQLPLEEKNRISHRARCFRQIREFLMNKFPPPAV